MEKLMKHRDLIDILFCCQALFILFGVLISNVFC